MADTGVRLSDLQFPATRVHVQRTRLAYIHIDNLLHFSKIDRDGRIDGFVAAYLPDEVALLFLLGGNLATSVAIMERGREVLPIATALERIHRETERGELVFCEAPREQLAWMYASCAEERTPRPVALNEPELLFRSLKQEAYSGTLELISEGRVTYFSFEQGKFQSGHFCGKDEGASVSQHVESLFRPVKRGATPSVAATLFPLRADVPEQAPPAMVDRYRGLYWKITDTAEKHAAGEAAGRAAKVLGQVSGVHPSLGLIGAARDGSPEPMVVSSEQLTAGLAEWAGQLLQQLEVIAPGVAPVILRDATREHRFVLQKTGFFDKLPWSVNW